MESLSFKDWNLRKGSFFKCLEMTVICDDAVCISGKCTVNEFIVVGVCFDGQSMKMSINFFNEWAVNQRSQKSIGNSRVIKAGEDFCVFG